ncbi:MAG: 4-(cytidine 5'-diphospho)-2-C-methyl-D-erythritol kinase [Bacteroidales bacterium]|nr:4-(cytidine 5'-diphospho)-2-C-methyl-D-erythritol kinase [Bacteroidales bacterium]
MKSLANFKVNLGLYVTGHRPDGYHNLETVFFPVHSLCDEIEVTPKNGDTHLEMTGGDFVVEPEKNLCLKAFRLMQEKYDLSGAQIRLVKNIPSGAGLGGGSADAAVVLKLTNAAFHLQIHKDVLKGLAAQLGSDVPFFLENIPSYATGRGEILRPFPLQLEPYRISVFKPDFSIPTAEAYSRITPVAGRPPLCDLLTQPVETWREQIPNDFEKALFPLYPQLAEIKQEFYRQGAVYASLSGSGSAVFAIAPHPIDLSSAFKGTSF